MVHAARAPFRMDAKYPTPLRATWTRLQNFLYNRLYPVHPMYFGSSVALMAAFNWQYPNNRLMELVPVGGSGDSVVKAVRSTVVAVVAAYIPVWILRRFVKHVLFAYKGWLYESNRGQISLATKLWGVCMGMLRYAKPKLHSCDRLLPALPLPALKDTVRRHLESVEPLLNEAEYQEMVHLAKEFESGVGRKLQFYLWLYSLTTDNYVSDMWKKYAYLYQRESLLINSSVAHADLFVDHPATQACRAAHVVYIEALSMLAIDNESLRPLGNSGITLCANHYDNMYSVSRIPGEKIDKLRKHGVARHVAVLSNGCFYKVEAFDGERLLSLAELEIVFDDLLNRKTEPMPAERMIGALTTTERAVWAKNRAKFFSSPVNRAALDIIESAAFFLILAEEENDYDPEDSSKLDKYLKAMLTGNGYDRWVDKSLNYVIHRNGRAGGTTEHSIGDGFEFDHVLENFVYMDNYKLSYDKAQKELTRTNPKLAERIKIEVTQECQQEIMKAYETYKPRMDDVDLASLIFRDFGKGHLKKGNVSPDAFVQMAIQLANFRDQGKFVLTYEAASARFFSNGRTETLRTVTKQSCAFVRAMVDPSATNAERLKLLRSASVYHGVRNRDAMVGMGIDRHFFVLYIMSKYFNIDSPYLNKVMGAPWLLSTSQAPTVTNSVNEDEHVDWTWLGACFAAVAKDGYGVCYRFGGNHSICLHVTSFKSANNTDSKRFRQYVNEAFHQMAALFDTDETLKKN
uniref:Choline/carnitine acyltransferase domain-containing protein n=1 Tax=Plectus sambesii TaxID=2011161 RepID=A0A914VD40_9BILA